MTAVQYKHPKNYRTYLEDSNLENKDIWHDTIYAILKDAAVTAKQNCLAGVAQVNGTPIDITETALDKLELKHNDKVDSPAEWETFKVPVSHNLYTYLVYACKMLALTKPQLIESGINTVEDLLQLHIHNSMTPIIKQHIAKTEFPDEEPDKA